MSQNTLSIFLTNTSPLFRDSSRVGDKFVAFVKDGWNSVKRFTGDHDIEAHRILNDEPQQIGRKEHRASFFTIVYFPPEDETEADMIKLRIEFRGSAIQGERFTSADLDVMFTYKDSHHPFALHRKPVDSITVLNVSPSMSRGEPTAVHCRHGRQTSIALGLSHDPVNGNVEWKRQSCMEFAHITSSSVEGFGVGTPRVAWSFREDPTAAHGLDAHYDLSIILRKNVRQHMIRMGYFAKAKTSGGYSTLR